jgi:hypothetical protein
MAVVQVVLTCGATYSQSHIASGLFIISSLRDAHLSLPFDTFDSRTYALSRESELGKGRAGG